MKHFFISCIIFSCVFPLKAQKKQESTYKYGMFNQWEFDLKNYELDMDAEAVVLFDLGNTYFFLSDQGGYDIRYTRTRRVKILNEAGLGEAEIEIPFYVDGYNKTERIVSIRAHTVNLVETGRAVYSDVYPQNIFEEIVNERWRIKKFAFPNVKPGSIIEYEVVLESPFLFNMPNWEFQDRIPTIYSEYQCRIIPFYEYVFYAQGISRFDIQESYVHGTDRQISGVKFNDMVHRYALKDVPAFKDESFITSIDDYIIKLRFQLAKVNRLNGTKQEIISTWPSLKKDLLKHDHFGKYIKSADRYNKKLFKTELSFTGGTESEIVKEMVNYVKNNITWDNYQSKYTNRSINEVFKEKKGNVAEINLYLCSLLRQANIKAKPVILSTRSNGKIKVDYPFASFFNYVIVLVEADGQQFLVDATDANLPYNRIPIRCINDKGLIIDEGEEAEFIEMYNQIQSSSYNTLAMKLNEDDELEIKASLRNTEALAYLLRDTYNDNLEQLKSKYKNEGIHEIIEINTLNFENKDDSYSISLTGESPTEKINDLVVVKPFLNFPLSENPLKQKKRKYPVDLIFKRQESITAIIEFPETYSINTLPKGFNLDNPLVKISTNYSIAGDNMIKASSFVQFKKAIYYPVEYSRIKYYFDQMIKEFNKEIIFQKGSI